MTTLRHWLFRYHVPFNRAEFLGWGFSCFIVGFILAAWLS